MGISTTLLSSTYFFLSSVNPFYTISFIAIALIAGKIFSRYQLSNLQHHRAPLLDYKALYLQTKDKLKTQQQELSQELKAQAIRHHKEYDILKEEYDKLKQKVSNLQPTENCSWTEMTKEEHTKKTQEYVTSLIKENRWDQLITITEKHLTASKLKEALIKALETRKSGRELVLSKRERTTFHPDHYLSSQPIITRKCDLWVFERIFDFSSGLNR